MKCLVEMKITVLDGKEKGRTFSETQLCDTETRYEEYGIIDQLRIEWNHIREWKGDGE